MATSATKNDPIAQVEQLNEQFVSAARKAGNWYLDTTDKTVDDVISLQHKVVEVTGQDWLKDAVEAQGDVTRQIVKVYTDTARAALN
jgi:hypothetical protein